MEKQAEKNLLQKWAPNKPANHEMADYTTMVKDCAKSKVILIRHANTVCNARVAALQKENEIRGTTLGEWMDLYSDTSVYDNKLTERGIEQCRLGNIHAKKVNFKYVWVSPMRRALETAYLIMKDHPNFGEIKFIIHPDIREKLGGADDVPSQNIQNLFKEYNEKFNGNLDSTTYWRHS
jgi:broad specificity phosphatase PhoE